jgi:hypothetical protein
MKRRRFACGINWCTWSIGLRFYRIEELGFAIELNILPFTCYWSTKGVARRERDASRT